MRRLLIPFFAALLLCAACDSAETLPPTTSTQGGGGGVGGAAGMGGTGGAGGTVCGSGNRTLDPSGLTELSYDDGVPAHHVRNQTWTISGQALAEIPLHEAVRFELEHPAIVHGFKVMWTDLPPAAATDPLVELEAGLYPDFGYNGFDFWAPDPYWTGTRCSGDIVDGEWVDYVLDEPVVIEHPGLVYVAHRSNGPGEGVWWFDDTVAGDPDNPCASFYDCQSAINAPEVEQWTYYNGVSFPFQYHYMVRLYVEFTDNVAPEDTFFQEIADSPSNKHVSFGDYDNDGYDDLLLGGPTLYHNEGDGTFSDATAAAGLDGLSGTGGVWGDYDNDGCLDLFVYAESYATPDTLLRSNCDGTFSDVTAAAGIVDYQTYNDCGDPANTASPSAAAAWLDIDSDGLLDVYMANFNCWDDYSFYTDTVYRNNGDSTFSEWTATHGFVVAPTPSRGAAPIDFDRDGDTDLLVHNYVLKRNLFFENNGDGTVSESALAFGLAGEQIQGYYGHTIGTAWGDLDNDGDFDNIQGNLAHPRFFDFSDKTQVLINSGGTFSDISGDWTYPASDAGLRYQETHSVPVLADIDQDGNLDLAITCVYDGRPTDFYWGNGDGTFTLDAYHAGITTENGWGAAVADFDNDGDMDLFATTLFENTLTAAEKGHWLQIRAVGNGASNWAAIGATVEVIAGSSSWIRHVQGGSGKGGQDSLYLHFGLGTQGSVDEVRIRFPAGGEVIYNGPIGVDQRIWAYEDGTLTTGWTP